MVFGITIRRGNAITKDNYLDIKFNNKNQVDDKIAWGLGGGFLFLDSSYVLGLGHKIG